MIQGHILLDRTTLAGLQMLPLLIKDEVFDSLQIVGKRLLLARDRIRRSSTRRIERFEVLADRERRRLLLPLLLFGEVAHFVGDVSNLSWSTLLIPMR